MKILHIDLNILNKGGYPNTYCIKVSEESLPIFQKMLIKWAPDDTFIKFNIEQDAI